MTIDTRDLDRTEGEGTTKGHTPGEEGLWVFLLGDMMVFALFFGTIVVTRGQQPGVFRAGQEALHPWFGITNTMLLLTGSILVVYAVRAVREHATPRRVSGMFAGAVGCGLGFAAIKGVEYSLLVGEGHTPGDDDFFMYYFVFTGIHLAHLVIGVVLLAYVAVSSLRGPAVPAGARRLSFVEGAGCYWHMVDLLWLVLFPLLYLVR